MINQKLRSGVTLFVRYAIVTTETMKQLHLSTNIKIIFPVKSNLRSVIKLSDVLNTFLKKKYIRKRLGSK